MKYVLYLHEYWWDATPKVNKMDESSLLGLQVTQSFFKLHYIFIHRRPFWHLKTQFVTRASCFFFVFFLNISFKSFIIYNSLRNTLMGWFDNAYTIWNMRFFNIKYFLEIKLTRKHHRVKKLRFNLYKVTISYFLELQHARI